jgi:hypothetical protein
MWLAESRSGVKRALECAVVMTLDMVSGRPIPRDGRRVRKLPSPFETRGLALRGALRRARGRLRKSNNPTRFALEALVPGLQSRALASQGGRGAARTAHGIEPAEHDPGLPVARPVLKEPNNLALPL